MALNEHCFRNPVVDFFLNVCSLHSPPSLLIIQAELQSASQVALLPSGVTIITHAQMHPAPTGSAQCSDPGKGCRHI